MYLYRVNGGNGGSGVDPEMLVWDESVGSGLGLGLTLTPPRGHRADQSVDAIEVQLSEPMSFIGATYRNMGEGLFIGAEMTQGQFHHRGPPQHG